MEPKYYKYKAKDHNGYDCAGTLKAASEEAAREQLEGRDLKPFFIEEDTDATRRVSKNTMRQEIRGNKRSSLKNEILSYAMPAGAIFIGLMGIPIALHFLKPVAPELPPEKVIEQYYDFEKSGKYKEQFEILSADMKKAYEGPDKYAEEKRRELIAEDPSVFQGRINNIENIKEAPRLRHFKVRIFRTTGMDLAFLHLVPSKKHWTIDAVRDPASVGRYLRKMAEVDAPARRPLIVELKKITAYSDQEIENLFKEYRLSGKTKSSEGASFPIPF